MTERRDPADPSTLTTAQLVREIAALKEIVLREVESLSARMSARLDAMDTAIVVFNEGLTRVPTAVDRAVSGLKELHGQEFLTVRGILETRMDGMDKAVELLRNAADKFPERMDEKIASLERVNDEKFASIQTQFKERDTRSEQSSKDSKVAVDAALQAAKEAVGEQNKSSALAISKSEAGTAKQIDAMGALITSGNKALDEKVADVKDRLTRLEGRGAGEVQAKAATKDTGDRTINLVFLAIALIGAAIGVAGFLAK